MFSYTRFRAVFISFLLAELFIPSTVHFNANNESAIFIPSTARAAFQNSNIRIKEINPVVNEGNQIKLTAIDANGQELNDAAFESGSTDIASVDPRTGMVRGIQRGFATVTARRGADSVSTFVVVARVESNRGAKVPGDTKTDTGGRIYISDPLGNVILRKDGTADAANPFAGSKGVSGRKDGNRTDSLFAGPTGVAVDNGAFGGIYVADTLNHSIRKIGFNNQVATILGTGSPGITQGLRSNDLVKFDKAEDVFLSSPRGAVTDAGGNLFIADTDNHAIYFIDFMKKEVRLLAGQPGANGKADGKGRAARFNRPSGIALKSDGKIIAVADTGNNRVRLITRDGNVTTVGRATSSNRVMEGRLDRLQANDENEFNFTQPQSVSFDGVGNIYVIDKSGAQAQIITFPSNQTAQVVSLAQSGSFNQAVSIVVSGAQTFVLDNNAATDAEAVKVITVGAPEITNAVPEVVPIEGGTEITVIGKNFARESLVLLGDKLLPDAVVENAATIRFHLPQQSRTGRLTLSVQTRGGLAQRELTARSRLFSELAHGDITTIAGGSPFLGDGRNALKAALNIPSDVTTDGIGNLFIADSLNCRIRRVDAATGIITTVAGNGEAGFNGDGGLAISASLNFPTGVALDSEGNLFIADSNNQRIRRVDASTGIITTAAGDGFEEEDDLGRIRGRFSGDNGPALLASFNFPQNVTIDSSGNLFIADSRNNRIRRIDAATGFITTAAGSGSPSNDGDGGTALSAGLLGPTGVAIDGRGNLFISDFNAVRRVDAQTGVISTLFREGCNDIAIDGNENLIIITKDGARVLRISPNSDAAAVLAGNGCDPFRQGCPLGDGGPASVAPVLSAQGAAADGAGNILISETLINRIRRIDVRTGIISTVAGSGDFRIFSVGAFGGDDGPAVSASLALPKSLASDDAGNLFICDTLNDRIRRIDATTGIITTVAGGGNPIDLLGDGGQAVAARLSGPRGVAVDDGGNLFIADTNKGRIRKVDAATGIITTAAGNGDLSFSGDGGPALEAALFLPTAVAIDKKGNLFIVDAGNNRIRRVDASTGVITTIAGGGSTDGLGDGGPAVKAFLLLSAKRVVVEPFTQIVPAGDIAIDSAGNLIIADTFNGLVRKTDLASGIINTIAGGGMFDLDPIDDGGSPTDAALFPSAVKTDGANNLYIADIRFSRIRRVDARTGIITTAAGSGTIDELPNGFKGDGGPATEAKLDGPSGIAIDREGNLFFADTNNNAIRVVKGIAFEAPTGSPMITGASFNKPNLIIRGDGFGTAGARVTVNGQEIGSRITNQTDAQITLKGSKKKLNLKKGPNQITVTANGVTSNTFVFQLFAE